MVAEWLASFCKSYSHPGVLLKDHLLGVGGLCKNYLEKAGIEGDIKEAAEIIGKCHDLGKYTDYFQRHLSGEKVPRELSQHSKLSAVLSALVLDERLKSPQLVGMGFLCVASHHGAINEIDLLRDSGGLNEALLQRQLSSIGRKMPIISDELDELDLCELPDIVRSFDFRDFAKRLREAHLSLCWESEEKRQWKNYYTTLLLFSSLVDADKRDAGKVPNLPNPRALKGEIVQSYRKRAFSRPTKSKMNALREIIFSEADKRLNELLNSESPPRIITISAPTGSGKTLLGLHAALMLKDKLPGDPKIVYSLPFINIIEQTHSLFEDVLSSYYGTKPDIITLLKHHHLAIATNIHPEMDLDRQILLADSWESELVVTTFEQLMRAIIGCENSALKKFHNIANSILILDEVQAIPMEYWRLVRDSILKLSEELNVRIIFMTATMPTLFKGTGIELIQDRSHFKQLDRVNLILDLDKPVTSEEFAEKVMSKWKDGSSALVVLNTVRSSKRVYWAIKEKIGDGAVGLGSELEVDLSGKTILAYLSTSLIPKERKRRVEILRDLLKSRGNVILIATQVVEAGVDLDFDMAFRDIGPLDSIVQIAGRSNRNWRLSSAPVYVMRVIDDKGVEESKKIYGKILPEVTRTIFEGKKCVNESDFLEVMEEYYKQISQKMDIEEHPESQEIIENIKALKFRRLTNFSLIGEENKTPVYIAFDDHSERLLQDFVNAVKEWSDYSNLEEIFKHRAKIRKLRAEVENYIVEVYKDRVAQLGLCPMIEGYDIRVVPRNSVDAYYDAETGFKEQIYGHEKEGPIIL